MARRRGSGIDVVASMPWPAGIVLGLVLHLGIRYGIGWVLAPSANPMLSAMGKQAAAGSFAPLAWLALGACWLGAFISYLKQRSRKQLLETQTGLDSIRAMSWQSFEMLVGEAFRRQGYAVQETGLGGADGGIDLVLNKAGTTTLVQCKQWRSRQVTVNVVREMYGLLAHHGASEVKIVAIGDYTDDARRFAQGKPIELIQGETLLAMVRAVQTTPSTSKKASVVSLHSAPAPVSSPHSVPAFSSVPQSPPPSDGAPRTCPKCGSAMVERVNRRSKERFWGCAAYPKCLGTRPA
jgi:restriction system protein